MKRTRVALAIVILSFCVALVASSNIPEPVSNTATLETQTNSALYIHFANDEYHNTHIPDTSVAELISHLLGSTPLSANTDRSAFPKTNIFNKPKANLLVVFDSDDSEFSIDGKRIEINPASASDSVVALTNIATGATPYKHGIFGKSWVSPKGEKAVAYGNAQPRIVSIADIVSQTSDGHSLTVSASIDSQMAHALAAHSTTFQQMPFWNNHIFYYNTRSQSIASQAESIISKSEIFAKISALDGVEVNGEEVSVGKFVFNLSEEADFLFFAELVLFKNLESFVQQPYYRSLTKDDSSDLFAITVSTLSSLKAKYSAKQYATAVALVQSVVASLEKTLSSIYDNNLVAEIVFLGTPSASAPIRAGEVSTSNHVKEVDSIDFVMEVETITATAANGTYSGVNLSPLLLAEFQIIGFLLIVIPIALLFVVLAVCNISSEKETIFVAPAKKHV